MSAAGDTTHECPHPACATRVPAHMLACKPHWFAIPKPLRDSLWHAYNRYGPGSDAHNAAMDGCIRYLERNAP